MSSLSKSIIIVTYIHLRSQEGQEPNLIFKLCKKYGDTAYINQVISEFLEEERRRTMRVPEQWKSKRQIILETFFVERSAPRVAARLGKSPRYVRRVIHEYRDLVKKGTL